MTNLSETVLLGDACTFRSGWTSAAAPDGVLPMVRTSDLRAGVIQWESVPFCEHEPPDPEKFLLTDGDLVVARTGQGSAGTVGLVIQPPRAIFASYLLRLRPRPDIDGRYVGFFLQSPSGREELAERTQGAALVNLSAKRMASIELPLRPLSEQRLLAEQLLDTNDLVTRAKASLDSAEEKVAALQRDALRWARERVAPESGDVWAARSLDAVTINHDRRRVALNAAQRAERPGDIPYFGASGVIDHVDGWTHDGTFLLVSEDGGNLVSRNHPIAFVASGRFWANNHVHVLEPDDTVSPDFLALAINATDVTPLLSGTTQPKLAKRGLAGLVLDVPPLEVQRTVEREASELLREWDGLLNSVRDIRRRLTEAWDVALEEAFDMTAPVPLAPNSGVVDALVAVDALVVTSDLSGDGDGDETPPLVPPSELRRRIRTERPLYSSVTDALAAEPDGLTPDELFEIVDWRLAGGTDPVDAFYAALKTAVERNEVRESRDGSEIRLVST